MTLTYAQAGVNIDEGNAAVEAIVEHVERTRRPEVLGGLGGFGGLFALDSARYREPVLVSGTDGVGTKLAVALAADQLETVGIDCVAMCVNDILVSGAEPLFFLDYVATGHLKASSLARIVKGVADGCVQARCALIGGETAEMPGFYKPGDFDIAGFAVGVVERQAMMRPERVKAGDLILGLSSTGLHSNGYSLARRVLLDNAKLDLQGDDLQLGRPLREVLLAPTRIYVDAVLDLIKEHPERISAMAHITGGGLLENLPRAFGDHLDAKLDKTSWPVPAIFEAMAELGPIAPMEMYRTFNMGIGFCVITPPSQADVVMQHIACQGYAVQVIGKMVPGRGRVIGLEA